MTGIEKENALRSIVWDYQVRGDRLLQVLHGLREREGPFDQEKLLLRGLERLPWHEVLDFIGKDRLKELVTPERIARPRFPEQRRRYERIRKILQGETVSFSGWDPRQREAYRRSLLSNRWYRAQPAL